MGLFDKLKNKAAYKFDDPPNTVVIICCHALSGEEPILNVFHDIDDGTWQFLCNKTHTTDNARIVGLQEVFDFDNSIGTLSHMQCGYFATRKSGNDHWVINKH